MRTKRFLFEEHRLLLAVLLFAVVAGIVVFSQGSPTGYQGAGSVSRTLVVQKLGIGGGTISSADGKISCPPTCTSTFNDGTIVTLTAAPASNAAFGGWGGGCFTQQTTICKISMTSTKLVTATFNSGTESPQQTGSGVQSGLGSLDKPTLTIVKAGTGKGTVTSNVGSINCGASCAATYNLGSPVILTATPDTGSTFSGWSSGCVGTKTCTVFLISSKTITATFASNTGQLPQGNIPPEITAFTAAVAGQAGDLTEVTAAGDTTVSFKALATDKDPNTELSFILYFDTSAADPTSWPKTSGKFLGVAIPTSLGNYNYKAPTTSATPKTYTARLEATDGTDTVKKEIKVTISPAAQQKPQPASVKLEKGWNLISFPGTFTTMLTNCDENGMWIFYFNAEKQQYSDAKRLSSIKGNNAEILTGAKTSFWVYSPTMCNMNFDITQTLGMGAIPLYTGWNFIPVTADTEGKSLNAIGKSCGLTAAYGFDSTKQSAPWVKIGLDDLLTIWPGKGLVVYAKNACTLGE